MYSLDAQARVLPVHQPDRSTSVLSPVDGLNLLRVADLSAEHLNALLNSADAMRDGPAWWTRQHPRAAVGYLFDSASTRTRVTFEAAAQHLGMLPILLGPAELRRESLEGTVRVLSSHTVAIAVQTPDQATLEGVADAASVPVINAGTDQHNPCQAIADLLTLRRHFGYLDGLRIAYVGISDDVTHSLMEAGALAGMHVMVASPRGFEPDREVTARAGMLAELHGGFIHVGRDPRAAVANADVVYTGAWPAGDDKPERPRRPADLATYRVDAPLMRLASRHALFAHGRPECRGDEVTTEIIDGPASAVWEQAANRLPTAQALLHAVVTGRWDG
jgi:ornithine carbamoyltransferase